MITRIPSFSYLRKMSKLKGISILWIYKLLGNHWKITKKERLIFYSKLRYLKEKFFISIELKFISILIWFKIRYTEFMINIISVLNFLSDYISKSRNFHLRGIDISCEKCSPMRKFYRLKSFHSYLYWIIDNDMSVNISSNASRSPYRSRTVCYAINLAVRKPILARF